MVYEIREQPTTLGGAVFIPANGLRLLDRLGVYETLREGGSITSEMIFHSTNGSELGRLDIASNIKARTGYGHMRIKRTVLMDALLSAAHVRGIPIHFGKRLATITEDTGGADATVTFSDRSSDTADLVLGCDGIHSAVRSLHVDPRVVPEYSGISSVASIIPMSTELAGLHMTFNPEGVIAVVPCTDSAEEKELFWFLSREITPPDLEDTRDGWNEHGRKEVAAFKTTVLDILHDIGGSWGSFLRRIINSTETVNFYPIYRLPRGGIWHTRRCVLLGDAAHAMQPHAGQGVSMALEDVFLFSRLLKRESAPLEECLCGFEQLRRPRVEDMADRAANNGQRVRRKEPWQMTLMEWGIWAWLWASRWSKSFSWGVRDEDVVYDIEAVDLDDA